MRLSKHASRRLSFGFNRQRATIAAAALAAAAGSARGSVFTPVILNNSSFTVDIVVEKGSLTDTISKVTASMDDGTLNPSANTWFEIGFDPNNPTHGLPASGSVFTSQNDPNHQFKMQSYGPVAGDTGTTHNNALLLGDAGVTSGTMTLTNPQPYSALSILASSGNGTGTYNIVINYADSIPSSTISGVQTPDWFGSGTVAWDAHGRVVPNAGTASPQNNGNDPLLYQSDFTLPDSTDPISSITLTGYTSSGGGRTAFFAISGVATAASTTVTYTGANGATFDTTSTNFKNAGGTATQFVTGNLVVFDDSATGTSPHVVTVASGGVQPSTVTFNNNTSNYMLTGGPIAGGATVTITGTGMVQFNNSNSYLGDTTVNAGTFVIGSTGSIASSNVNVASSAAFTIVAGGQATSSFNVINNGTVNLSDPARTLTSLQGSGLVNLNGTALTAGSGSNFTGSFGGTGGSLNLTGGSISVSTQTQIAALTGGITVGATGSVILTTSSPVGSATVPLTLATQGTLTTVDGVNAVYNGPINVTGAATISAGADDLANSSITLNGVISGTGPINFAATGQPGGTPPEVILGAANTYSGETQLAGDGSLYDTAGIQLAVDNGISINSGFAFTSISTGGGLVVDLNGHNQSVTYLRGGLSSLNVISNAGTASTLTISNGNNGAVNSVFGATISGNISLLKTGSGNQIFIGTNNSYNGATNIAGGTLTAATPTAFGSSPIILSGGKLGLATQAVGPATISGFSNFTETTSPLPADTGGPGIYTATSLELTTGANSQANSAFTKTVQAIPSNGFAASFTYTATSGADGVAFVLQNDPRGANAIGGSGGGLGYGGVNNGTLINNSVAVELNIYTPNIQGTALGINGNIPSSFTPTGSVNLSDGNAHNVVVIYSPATQTLTETIDGSFSDTFFGVNLAAAIGGTGNSAFVGFTGASGGVTSTQTISNFTFGSLSNVPVSIANTVTATAGTTSAITFPVTPTSTTATIGALTIPAGATVAISTTNSASNAGHGVLVIPSFSNSGTLDVGTNDADIQGSDLTTITNMVKSGFNAAGGGHFNGTGITSSAAAADSKHLTAVGVILNNVNGTQIYGTSTTAGPFDGSNPGSTDILVKYTYFGDANLDGKVDGSDYSLIDNGFINHLTGWYNGDFNYDGIVDGSDYTLIDNAFNTQGSVLSATSNALIASPTTQIAGSAVPEPSTLGLIGIATTALLRRRRK